MLRPIRTSHRTNFFLHLPQPLMQNKLIQAHWFDKDMLKILERYELQEPSAQFCLDRGAHLAQAAFHVHTSMIILADFQSYRLKSTEEISSEIVEKLFDLAHLLKEVEPELWSDFSSQPFFRDSDMWASILDFHFFSCQPIVNPDGVVLGWICLFDKTNRQADPHTILTLKTMADMVMDELDLRVQIKRSNRLHNEIVHLAAHDLKNPLSGILGIADHIKKQMHDAVQLEEICDLIKDSSKRMMGILDDILKSGFLESGKIKLSVSAQRFSEVLNTVIQSNQAAAVKKQQKFSCNIQEDLMVLVDRSRMAEVLDNLVNNAVKYAPKNSTIEINCHEELGEVVFSIFNTGVGLSEDDKSKIFHKFTKLSARPTGGESSTGLGLSIVKMLTEMHGGRIFAESEGLDKGVRFVLRLPALAEFA